MISTYLEKGRSALIIVNRMSITMLTSPLPWFGPGFQCLPVHHDSVIDLGDVFDESRTRAIWWWSHASQGDGMVTVDVKEFHANLPRVGSYLTTLHGTQDLDRWSGQVLPDGLALGSRPWRVDYHRAYRYTPSGFPRRLCLELVVNSFGIL